MAIGTGEEHDDCPRFFDQDFGPVATVGPSVSLPVPLGTGTYLPVPAGLRWFISKKLDFFFTLSELNDPTYYAGDVVAEIVRVGGAAPGDEPPAVVSTFTRGFKSTGQGEGVNFNREFQSFTVFTPGFYLLRLTSIAARCSIADIAGTVDILKPVEF
jgi:hypothetical protein